MVMSRREFFNRSGSATAVIAAGAIPASVTAMSFDEPEAVQYSADIKRWTDEIVKYRTAIGSSQTPKSVTIPFGTASMNFYVRPTTNTQKIPEPKIHDLVSLMRKGYFNEPETRRIIEDLTISLWNRVKPRTGYGIREVGEGEIAKRMMVDGREVIVDRIITPRLTVDVDELVTGPSVSGISGCRTIATMFTGVYDLKDEIDRKMHAARHALMSGVGCVNGTSMIYTPAQVYCRREAFMLEMFMYTHVGGVTW